MKRLVLRVWLPDKPGALGRVASAIGSINASLVGIDILEQGGGWAIDELIVEVDDESVLDSLVAAITSVEGTHVEDARATLDQVVDPRVDALESAAVLVSQVNVDEMLRLLVQNARHDLWAQWSAIVQMDGRLSASSGDAPTGAWLRAFVDGSRSAHEFASNRAHAEDVAWAPLHSVGSELVVGRSGRPFRSRERRQLEALTKISDGHIRMLKRQKSP